MIISKVDLRAILAFSVPSGRAARQGSPRASNNTKSVAGSISSRPQTAHACRDPPMYYANVAHQVYAARLSNFDSLYFGLATLLFVLSLGVIQLRKVLRRSETLKPRGQVLERGHCLTSRSLEPASDLAPAPVGC